MKCARDKRTRGCTAGKMHDFETNRKRHYQPREKEDVAFLMIFWTSAVAADGDVECTVFSRYSGGAVPS